MSSAGQRRLSKANSALEFLAIQQLWKEQLRQPFPRELAGEEINSECLVQIDSTAAGIITTFVGGSDALSLYHEQLRILTDCAKNLDKACPLLPAEHRSYFDPLREISERVVCYCRND